MFKLIERIITNKYKRKEKTRTIVKYKMLLKMNLLKYY